MRESDRRLASKRLTECVRTVRRRWRLRVVIQGLAWTGVFVVGLLALVSLALEWARFAPEAVIWGRAAGWGAVLAALLWFVARPALRRVDERRAALYLDENEPSLRHSVTTALETEENAPSALHHRLVSDALGKLRRIEQGRRVERGALARVGAGLAGVVILALVTIPWGPEFIGRGAAALLPTTSADEANPYSVAVEPGDTTVARESDQEIKAVPGGFQAGEAFLFARRETSESFTRTSMLEDGSGGFTAMLLDLAEPTEYFVEIAGVASPTYVMDVRDLPRVERLDLVLRHPDYTGLPPTSIEDGGDFAALPGTVAEVTVHANMATRAGRLVVGGGPVDELVPEAPTRLGGSFVARADGYYSIELATEEERFAPASPEYAVTLLSDDPPQISFRKPGRDVPASPIEEVFLEARAFDDYGVRNVMLVSSVNGGPEDTVPLFTDSEGALEEVSAGHALFLEEWTLEPGDLVAYYALASDRRPGSEPVASDMFFVKVRPFDVAFRQSEQQGGGEPGEGGQAGPESAMSEMQRQIVSATFNLIRQRDSYENEEFDENVVSVALAQGRLREQVGTLLQRMANRGIMDTDPGFRDVSAILPQAIEAMTEAKELLDEGALKEALAPEQTALRFLQQAEETYERYVSQGREQQGGGGGGGQQAAEDLADLFELELDKLKNQYETVRRGQQQNADNEVDELIEKLSELARRQEQEAERQARRSAGNAGGSSSQAQRQLAEETEEAARRLERLAREMNDAELEETARGLREAADAMRRSGSRRDAGADQANSSLRRLRDAQRRMEEARSRRARRDAEAAIQRVEELQRRQREVQGRVRDLPRDRGSERNQEIERLRERKDQMTEAVRDLEAGLDRAAAGNRAENPAAARELQEAADQIRESKLKEKLLYSRGTIEQWDPESASTLEMDIEADLQALRDRLQRAAEAVPSETGPDGLEDALEETRDLVRSLETMGRRLTEPSEANAGSRTSEEGEREPRSGDPQGSGRTEDERGAEGGRGGEEQGLGVRAGGGNPNDARDGSSFGGGLVRPRELSPEEVRQSRRQFERDGERVRRLWDQLRMEGRQSDELAGVLDAMARLERERIYDDPGLVAQLHGEILDALRRLEFGLRREVEGDDRHGAALTSLDEVPEGFRELVEEYYRALARSGGSGGGSG